MGACVSKPWEIDLRDICQRLRSIFACCKGQNVIHTTEVDGAEIEDIEENVKKDISSLSCLALHNQNLLKLSKEFGPHVNMNLSKVFLKT